MIKIKLCFHIVSPLYCAAKSEVREGARCEGVGGRGQWEWVVSHYECYSLSVTIGELKKTTTATATGTSINRRFNEQPGAGS